jgi:hypothetical protein
MGIKARDRSGGAFNFQVPDLRRVVDYLALEV